MSHFLRKTQENINFRENYRSKVISDVSKNPHKKPFKTGIITPRSSYIKNFERIFKK